MKTILKIARTELALLFFSPIAWFLLVVFLFQCGLVYTSNIEGFLTSQELGGTRLARLVFLTQRAFAPPFGVFTTVARNLYLYLPLLTMGLMSREISSGTIKLLYSSPIKVREIIFGKYIAMMIYNLLLVGVLAVMVIAGLINIRSADGGLLLAGMLGIYLLLCTYAAIGLFMSCLTSYQVVAALCTLVLLAALSYVGNVWQGIDLVRDLTYFLSITGRAEHMMLGLVTTKDLLYFLVIIFIFLGFSIYKLQGDRESKPGVVKAGRYALIVVLGLAAGSIFSLPGLVGYLDLTATKMRTLTVGSQEVIKKMQGGPLEVTTYVNLLDNFYYYGSPEQRNTDLARWEPYLRFKPDIHFNYVYYYDSAGGANQFKYNPGMTLKGLAEKYAKSYKLDIKSFKTPAEIRQVIDLRPEQNRYVMQLKYKGRSTFLRLFNDQIVFPTETETAAALKRLTKERLPKIAFAEGELERSIDKIGDKHYKVLTNEITFRYSLVNQGFDVETVSLKTEEIPADIAALVIADPRVAFDTAVVEKIRRYIAAGGNLLIAGEPGRQSILEPLLQPLGVQLMEGELVQQSKEFSPDLARPYLAQGAMELARNLKQDLADSIAVTMPNAAALSYTEGNGFTVKPLLKMDERSSWERKKPLDPDLMEFAENSSQGTGGMAVTMVSANGYISQAAPKEESKDKKRADSLRRTLVYSAADGDVNGSLPTALSLTRMVGGKEQRIVVAGDADFLDNAELARNNLRTSNFEFSTAIFGWFTYGEFPTDTSRPPGEDTRIKLTDGGMSMLKIFLLGVLPGLVLVLGAVLLVRRKRK